MNDFANDICISVLSAFAKAIQKEILGTINLDEFTSSEEQTPSMKNSPKSNKENKAPTHTPTC